MKYKLLWQLEREENTKLRRELRVQKAIKSGTKQGTEMLLDEIKDLKDKIDTLMTTIERERSDIYANGIR